MGSAAEMYIKRVKSKLINYFAAWMPNEPLELGDVGLLEKNLFTRVTSLADLGIAFEIRDDPHSTPIDIVSNSDVSMSFKVAGAISPKLPNIPEAEAGIGLEFGKKGAFIFKAENSFAPSIKNIAQVQEKVLQAHQDGKWNRKWAVIVKLVKTPKATIIISNSSSAKLELQADGGVSLANLDLGNAELKFGIASQQGDLIKMIGAENISPFFQLAGIKERIFKPDVVTTLTTRTELSPFDAHAPDFGELTSDQQAHFFFDQIVDSDEW